VTTDVDVINDLFTSGVVSIFGDVFTLAGIMIVMLSMNWRLALVAFAVLPLIVLVTQWFRRNVRESYRTVRRLIARINAYLQEHITGMGTVQLFRREARAYAQFLRINQEHRTANVESISTTRCSPGDRGDRALAAADDLGTAAGRSSTDR
jgi:ATP-binding cassette subfamily B protein